MTTSEMFRKLLKQWRGIMSTEWNSANDPGEAPAAQGTAGGAQAQRVIAQMQAAQHRGPLDSRSVTHKRKLREHCARSIQVLEHAMVGARAVQRTHLPTRLLDYVGKSAIVGRVDNLRDATRALTQAKLDEQMKIIKTRLQQEEEAPPWAGGQADPDVNAAAAPATGNPLEPFLPVSDVEYQRLKQAWENANEDDRGAPPLNPDQRRAYLEFAQYIVKLWQWKCTPDHRRGLRPRGPLLMVDAMPGAGKSTALSHLCEWVKKHTGGGMQMECTAMTGSAATIVHGQTVFTLLSIGWQDAPKNERVPPLADSRTARVAVKRNELQNMFNPCNSAEQLHPPAVGLSCDEMSQFYCGMLSHISDRMQEAAPDDHLKKEPFGGHGVILQGDFFQMEPVGQSSMFTSVMDGLVRGCPEGNGDNASKWIARFGPSKPEGIGAELLTKFKRKTLETQVRPLNIQPQSLYILF